MGKYRNTVIKIDGKKFDSKKEFARYLVLKDAERNGQISNLKCQVPYTLIPSQKINGKVVERAVIYKADFVYIENGKLVVEDVKSAITHKDPKYILKRKLMLYTKGIRIKEII